jgi:hypothetical protein
VFGAAGTIDTVVTVDAHAESVRQNNSNNEIFLLDMFIHP